MAMDAELKAEWIAALRSGERKQGKYALKSEHTGAFCCLGVLCDIMEPNAWEPKYATDVMEGEETWVEYLSHPMDNGNGFIHKEFKKFTGLSDRDQERLATMNDIGQSFGEIADYIEENL